MQGTRPLGTSMLVVDIVIRIPFYYQHRHRPQARYIEVQRHLQIHEGVAKV